MLLYIALVISRTLLAWQIARDIFFTEITNRFCARAFFAFVKRIDAFEM
jgi:hypothetical protein